MKTKILAVMVLSLLLITSFAAVASAETGSKLPIQSVQAEQEQLAETDNHPATAVIDGDLATRWANTQEMPVSITFDLGDVKSVSSVKIAPFKYDARAYKYDILVSKDNSTWTEVAKDLETGMGEEWTENTFDAVDGRYVKLTFSDNSDANGWASLFEVEVYGSEAAAAPAGNPQTGDMGMVPFAVAGLSALLGMKAVSKKK